MRTVQYFLYLFLVLFYCCQSVEESHILIYENDFESGSAENLQGEVYLNYNNSRMLGNYNNGGFLLNLGQLPDHDFLSLSMDLYIHDSWDGNNNEPDGPDLWSIAVDNVVFSTTFSNTDCGPLYCIKQSFPNVFPTWNYPKSGAFAFNLPVICHNDTPATSTSVYRVLRLFKHSSQTANISIYDNLVQSNTADQKCDESWSLDNLSVTAIKIE